MTAVTVVEGNTKQEETEDQKAIRALISSAEHGDDNDGSACGYKFPHLRKTMLMVRMYRNSLTSDTR